MRFIQSWSVPPPTTTNSGQYLQIAISCIQDGSVAERIHEWPLFNAFTSDKTNTSFFDFGDIPNVLSISFGVYSSL